MWHPQLRQYSDCFYQYQYFPKESNVVQISELTGEDSNNITHCALLEEALFTAAFGNDKVGSLARFV